MFYEFDQNNSGGSFVTNDKLCHRLFIEADSKEEAILTAENLGCYWNGVEDGYDCPCCGDRWSTYNNEVNISKYNKDGYEVSVYDGFYKNTEQEWGERYGKYKITKAPRFVKAYSGRRYTGSISFESVEEYAQYLADEYGWTTPDARIFCKDGTVKEIFSAKKGN